MIDPTSDRPILDAIEQGRTRLSRELAPEQWDRVWDQLHLEVTHERERTAEVIAAHLPGLAPAILALAQHAINDDPESGCCGLPARLYGEGGVS